jgi:SET domain-containing protein
VKPKRKKRLFEVRKSKIAGLGVFATRKIPKGTRLIEYTGERLTSDESDRRYPEDDPSGNHHTFLFSIDDDVVIDAAFGGNDARWINHSCDPNCDAVIEDGRLWIETIRDVKRGEELAYDYAYELEERHTPAAKRRYPCRCGAANCRGTILTRKKK